jgi:hypothetical protein
MGAAPEKKSGSPSVCECARNGLRECDCTVGVAVGVTVGVAVGVAVGVTVTLAAE